jgi:hypothetical protein
VLWTPAELIFEVDGEPVGVTMTPDTINEAAGIRFSPLRLRTGTGQDTGGPIGHDMIVQSLRVLAYEK